MVQRRIDLTCDVSARVKLRPATSDRSIRFTVPPETSTFYCEVELPPGASDFNIHVERPPVRPVNDSTTSKRSIVHKAKAVSITKGPKVSVVQTQTASMNKASYPDSGEANLRMDIVRWMSGVTSSPWTVDLPIRPKMPPAQDVGNGGTAQALPRRQTHLRPFLIPRNDSSASSDSGYETGEPVSSSDILESDSSSDSSESYPVIVASERGSASGSHDYILIPPSDDDNTETESEDPGAGSLEDSEPQVPSINLESRFGELNSEIAAYKLAPKSLETEEHLVRECKRLLQDINATWQGLNTSRGRN